VLDIDELADEINKAIDAKDKDGNPIDTTPNMKTYAKAIITTYKAGLVSHPLVTGITASGAPLQLGTALNGIIAPLLPPTWLGIMVTGNPTSDPTKLAAEASASTTYLMASSQVNFTAGSITGICTSTPTSPGPLILGQGTSGKVAGLSGSAWSPLVMPPLGDLSLTNKIYTAISNYIMSKTEVTYGTGSIQGVCPPASGPLTGGVGVGGTIQ
jgi:hypothetical protein